MLHTKKDLPDAGLPGFIFAYLKHFLLWVTQVSPGALYYYWIIFPFMMDLFFAICWLLVYFCLFWAFKM